MDHEGFPRVCMPWVQPTVWSFGRAHHGLRVCLTPMLVEHRNPRRPAAVVGSTAISGGGPHIKPTLAGAGFDHTECIGADHIGELLAEGV